MSKQPEALRLADALVNSEMNMQWSRTGQALNFFLPAGGIDDVCEAAETLRTQHELLCEVCEALQDLAEAAELMRGTVGCIRCDTPEEADTYIHDQWAEEFLQERLTAAKAAIAKAEGKQ